MIDVGGTVGNYVVRAKIGEGGMGIVWFAEHPLIGKKVAIKVIHPTYARNPDAVSRFFTEAQAVNRVGHPNIVDITDFGQTPDGESYFVMEYLAGESLAQRLKRGGLELRRALHVTAQIADALAGSHDAGILHRDLKPDNVFLIQRGGDPDVVKVLDFGLAKLTGNAEKQAHHKTRTGSMMGTPYYMAPEQCAGKGDIDSRADVYALGIILFELLTGRVPFPGESYVEIIVQHMTQPAPRVRSFAPDVPPWLDDLVDRALAKDRAARVQTMAELRDIISAELGELPALRAPTRQPFGAAAPTARPLSTINMAAGERTTPPDRPARRMWPIAAAIGGLVVAGGAYALLAGGDEPAPPIAAAPPIVVESPDAAPAVAPPPAQVTIELTGEPAGAKVSREDGQVVCETTPCEWRTERGSDPVLLVFEKDGFQKRTDPVVPDRDKSVNRDLVALAPAETPAQRLEREKRERRHERRAKREAEARARKNGPGDPGPVKKTGTTSTSTSGDSEGLLKPSF